MPSRLPPSPSRAAGLLACLLLSLAGCASPKVRTAGARIGRDAYVVGTSPVQLPAMSARDAWKIFPEPAASVAAFPLTFPLYLVEHTVLTTIHVVDLAIFPVHFFNEWEPLGIYDTKHFPMKLTKEAHEAFQVGSGATAAVALGVLAAIAIPVFVL